MSKDWSNFFDPAKAKGPREGPDVVGGRAEPETPPRGKPDGPKPWTVTALVGRIRKSLSEAFPAKVTVLGEVSNFTRHGSGHLYFSLKDAGSTISCVMWRSTAGRLKFDPADGLEVVAEGRVDLYEVRGQVQLYVDKMTPQGEGALELAFRQLREKLQGEGLFDPDRKKPIPRFPRGVGVVTSPTGAAIRDIRRTLHRRWPGLPVYLVPARVQGDAAAAEVAEAIRLLDRAAEHYEIDTILIGRGGGSLEDLWAFNEEPVARAIAAAQTPIIAGVGHEVDVTIAELVADRRAATPTAAAELAVPDMEDIRRGVMVLSERLRRRLLDQFDSCRRHLEGLERSACLRDPLGRFRTARQHVDELSHRLGGCLREGLAGRSRRLEPLAQRLVGMHPLRLLEQRSAALDRQVSRLRWALGTAAKRDGDVVNRLASRLGAASPTHAVRLARQRVNAAARQLESMSYRSVLKRGYSVTRNGEGRVLRSAGEVRPGETLEIEFTDGRVRSTAGEGNSPSAVPPPPRIPRRKKKTPQPGPKLFDEPDRQND
ncbi:MAG: exodeoxyribonuclease VII large subunit [Phycisphaerae bacterium]